MWHVCGIGFSPPARAVGGRRTCCSARQILILQIMGQEGGTQRQTLCGRWHGGALKVSLVSGHTGTMFLHMVIFLLPSRVRLGLEGSSQSIGTHVNATDLLEVLCSTWHSQWYC